MAQGDILTKDIEKIIAEVWYAYLKKGGAPAKVIKADVSKEVKRRWPRRYKPDWPGLRAIQDHIAKIRGTYEEKCEELDKPWHMGLMAKYNVPAEAIPYILYVQDWAENLKQKQTLGPIKNNEFWLQWNHFDITIRQACWIARLYTLIDWDKVKKNKKLLEQALSSLWTWSKVYTLEELICWLSGIDNPDTSTIDKALREGWSAHILAYDYFLYPKDENMPGIMNYITHTYSLNDSLADVIKKHKQSEVKNERSHSQESKE